MRACAILLFLVSAYARKWTHPGVLVDEATLNAVLAAVAAKQEPQASAFAKALASPLFTPGGVPVGQAWTADGFIECGPCVPAGVGQEASAAALLHLRVVNPHVAAALLAPRAVLLPLSTCLAPRAVLLPLSTHH